MANKLDGPGSMKTNPPGWRGTDDISVCVRCGDPFAADLDGQNVCQACDCEFEVPEEGDYTTTDHIHWYQYGKLVLTTPDQDYAFVKAHMDQERFWPNAWFISDHGNCHLLSLDS